MDEYLRQLWREKHPRLAEQLALPLLDPPATEPEQLLLIAPAAAA